MKTARAAVRSTPRFIVYAAVWLALLAGTGLTVAAADLGPAAWAIVICLAIAAAKAALVFLFFMHLRWEKRLLVPITIAVLAIFIGLTFSDVLTR